MTIADYRTEKGAKRYAAEIIRKFPSVKAAPVPSQSFGYNVLVTLASGRTALADKRPRHYGNYGTPQHRIATQANI